MGEGFDAGRGEEKWIIEAVKPIYDEIFNSLQPDNGKLKRSVAKEELLKSKLPNNVLSRVYSMADVDDDGLLDIDEFAVAKYLIDLKLKGFDLPTELPKHLVPPSKKNLVI